MATILCVDDDRVILDTFQTALERLDHRVIPVTNGEAGLNVLGRGGVDLVLTDYRMPGMTGLEFVTKLRADGNDVPLVMITGHGSIEHAVSAMKAGATDYLAKPVRVQQLEIAVDQALELSRLRRENANLKAEVREIRGERAIIGESASLTRVLDLVRAVAPTRSTVLVQGESGTGKELVARAVHNWSDRADQSFLSVNCAALPETLIESTLFGHEKGAFTGATRMTKGAFERADRGTLLLDEVTEMRPELQAKLLRVLQEQEFERVGGGTPIRVDVRIVATSNRDLAEAVHRGTLREDLYYRLAVVPVTIPPLRDRKDDIPALAQRFAVRTAESMGKEITGVSAEALELLQAHDWPGNVRELSHAVERAAIMASAPVLQPEDFQLGFLNTTPKNGGRDSGDGLITLSTLDVKEAEAALIERALEETEQNRTRAAELLGISVRTLRNKLNQSD